MSKQKDILFNEQPAVDGLIGEIIINRAAKLNCLTLSMLQSLTTQLTNWQHNPKIQAVIIKSASDKAFCAGGDVRALYDMQGDIDSLMQFFTLEYHLNKKIFHFTKPYIALLDGISMGGGCGISLNGNHPIATENLTLAMPETKIGLFPDVGMSYHLSRCPFKLGWYFGLSGRTMDAATAYDMRLVKAIIKSHDLVGLEQALLTTPWSVDGFSVVTNILQRFSTQGSTSELASHYHQIEHLFSHPTIEDVLAAINHDKSDWAQALLAELNQRSPLSLKMTFEQFKRAENMSFDQVIQQDLKLVQHLMQLDEFFIGVKALFIDKNPSPAWQYATIQDIPDHVTDFF